VLTLKRPSPNSFPKFHSGSFDSVPFYNSDTNEQLGVYSDEAKSLDDDDCVGAGLFSFGAADPEYSMQISFSFTCKGEFNAITGGTGAYGCAKGYEEFVFEDDDFIDSQLTVCGPFCPVDGEYV